MSNSSPNQPNQEQPKDDIQYSNAAWPALWLIIPLLAAVIYGALS
jgi:hypothetical protein